MEDIDDFSHHSVYEEQQESKCINCLKFFISLEFGNIISLLNAILSVACLMIYIYTNYQPNVVLINSNIFFIINFSCRCFFALILILDIIAKKYDFSFKKIISLIMDVLSIIPYLLSRITIGMREDLISKTHLITSSFICFRLFSIQILKKYIHNNVNRELFSIISFLICLIFDFTIIVNVIENTETIGKYFLFLPRDCNNIYFCEGTNDTLHSTLFFIMTTIGIVGYNSTIVSILGRIIICAIIILGIYEIPSQFSNLISQLSTKKVYARATYKMLKGVKFILICGNVSVGTLSVLLKEYFHPDHGESEKHCLILMPKSPDSGMEELLKLYKNKLYYLEGDPLKFNDLQRCQFKEANMIMLLCNKQAADSSAEDTKTIIMAIAIKNFFSMNKDNKLYNDINKNALIQTNKLLRTSTFQSKSGRRSKPSLKPITKIKNDDEDKIPSKLIIQLLKPESVQSFSLLISGKKSDEQIVCIDQLKISLLAKGCLCKGIISLISNLIITNNFDESVEEQLGKLTWIEEYKNGKDYEIYKIPLDYLRGYKFNIVVEKIYNEKKTIIFGLNIEDKETKKNIVLLSPMDFILPVSKSVNIYGYLLAKDQGEADEVENWEKSVKKNSSITFDKGDIITRKFSKETEIGETKRQSTVIRRGSALDKLGISQYCHISNEEAHQNNITLDSMDQIPNIKDHIIICGVCHNMIDLIKPLRSKNFPKNILPPIVILSKDLPDKKLWNTIAYFENIYLIKGDAIEKSDLKRAGIKTAKYVILLAPSINDISNFTESQRLKHSDNNNNNSSEDEEENTERKNLSKDEEFLLDSQTILKYNQISKINKDIFCVVELINPKNVLFLNNRNRRNNDEYTFIQSGLSIDATASFAAGEVYYSNIMDNIITQAYYNPSLLSVLKKLIVGEEMQTNLKSEKNISRYLDVPSGSLYLIDLPLSLFKKDNEFNNDYHISFEKVFSMLLKKKIIVIGVYRYGSLSKTIDQEKDTINLGNFNDTYFYYVVTAPEPDFVVNQKDQLFVISPEYPRPEALVEPHIEKHIVTGKNLNLRDYNKNSNNIKNLRINEITKKVDEEMEGKLINFNFNLEKTRGLIDDIENNINKVTRESADYIKNSIKKKLYEIKNEKY